MNQLYPQIKPYERHYIKVDDPHKLYVEESGNPDGIPVLYIHGGPGSGCEPIHRRYFSPDKYRIILFDQRGCGKSTPFAELENNNTQALVKDIEVIRKALKVERWLLFGGSWGATLSLLYAQAFPKRIYGLVLRGIFLSRAQDIKWFYQQGANQVFPDYWEDFVAPIALKERKDLVNAYYKKLTGKNELARMAAAKAWALWEGRCATLRPSHSVLDHFSDPHIVMSLARIECHYFVNKSFLKPNQILKNAKKLKGIPGVIIHGRYDMVCPLENATALHAAWPDSRLNIIRDAGHAASEPAIIDSLIIAASDMADFIEKNE